MPPVIADYAKETGATVLLCTDHLESAEEICTSFAVLEHGFLRASGDLSMLTAASELTPMAVIRVSDTQKMPEDFTLHDGAWEKPIESEADMPELISCAGECRHLRSIRAYAHIAGCLLRVCEKAGRGDTA